MPDLAATYIDQGYLVCPGLVDLSDHRAIVPVVGDDPYPWKGIDEPPAEVFVRPWRIDQDWGDWDAAQPDTHAPTTS